MLNKTSAADSLMQIILKIAAKCKLHDITKFFISNLLYMETFEGYHPQNQFQYLRNLQKYEFYYVDNGNIDSNPLHKDGLYLLYAGKELLAKNSAVSNNNF